MLVVASKVAMLIHTTASAKACPGQTLRRKLGVNMKGRKMIIACLLTCGQNRTHNREGRRDRGSPRSVRG